MRVSEEVTEQTAEFRGSDTKMHRAGSRRGGGKGTLETPWLWAATGGN